MTPVDMFSDYDVAVGSPSNVQDDLRAHVYAAAVASIAEVVGDWNGANPEHTVGIDHAQLQLAISRLPEHAFVQNDEDSHIDFSVQLGAHLALALVDAEAVFTPAITLRDRAAESPAPSLALFAAYRAAVLAVEFREDCNVLSGGGFRGLHERLVERLRKVAVSRITGRPTTEVQPDVEDVAFDLWRLVHAAQQRQQQAALPGPLWRRQLQWAYRHKLVAAGIACVLTAAIVIVVTSEHQTAPPGTSPASEEGSEPQIGGFSGTPLLKNTSVELAAIDTNDRGVNAGQLPNFAPLTIDVDHGVTFRLRFTRIDSQAPLDNLQFFVQPLDPVKVQGAHQVLSNGTQPLPQIDSGDEVLVVPTPVAAADGTFATYEFVVAALQGRLNNGYFCGYTPKPVTAVIKSNGNELAIPYPIFIKRQC